MQSLEPALDCALVKHLIRPPRLHEAFELDGAEIAVFEEVTEEPARSRPDHDGVGFGEGLQPSGEVWRLADDRALLRRSLADQIADDDDPGADADAHCQLAVCCRYRHHVNER